MTDEEKIAAVTTALTGEFFVGQQIRTRAYGIPGVVGDVRGAWIFVRLSDGTYPPYLPEELEPA